jgi:hypothetical protein
VNEGQNGADELIDVYTAQCEDTFQEHSYFSIEIEEKSTLVKESGPESKQA